MRLLTLVGSLRKSSKTLLNVVFWAVFARDYAIYDSDALLLQSSSDLLGKQLGYLIVNSKFLAASILGNSALKPDQLVFQKEAFTLGVIGLELNKGYCIMSGPASITAGVSSIPDFVENWPDTFPISNRNGVAARFGHTKSAKLFDAALDRMAISQIYSSTPIELPYSKKEFDPAMFDDLPLAVIQITPIRSQ